MADRLWTEACGQDRWPGIAEHLAAVIRHVSHGQLWAWRGTSHTALVAYARKRVSQATVLSPRSATDYTVRMFHGEPGLGVTLEDNWILWHK